ncbi:MAG: hypothetical protein LC754_03105 [Acidobacteria bacterium]|nr:hypothetical protein [Acidobacteriota bacterium]
MDEAKNPAHDGGRVMLRHTVATLAYRGCKAVSNAPKEFRDFRVNEETRTPGEILAHIGDLLDWALNVAKGTYVFHESPPRTWDEEIGRFFAALNEFDSYLASGAPLGFPAEKLFQGPIADALTHVGQIALLRRMAGVPIRGENYFKAEIVAGRVGADQSSERVEFD